MSSTYPIPCILPLLAAAFLQPSTDAQSGAVLDGAAEAVAAARKAVGWDRLAAEGGGVRVEGRARFIGTDAAQTILFDAEGRFVQDFEGPLRQSNGTDGQVTWSRDWTDTPRVLVLGDLANSEVGALFLTGGWTAAGERLSFELGPSEAGEIVLAFTHVDGVLVGTIRLDAETHRPRSVEFGSDETRSTWTFENYREHDGPREHDAFPYPERIEVTQQGLAQNLEVSSVTRLPELDPAVFAPRLAPPADVRFDPAVPGALEVKRVPTGHLLVHPTVDGEDLGWFIFDSGAGINCISNAVTDGLEGPFGEIGARGIGGTVPSRFWRAKELRLGPVAVADPIFLGLDLAFLAPHFGVEVGGIIGFEFLARCVAELDMLAGTIALADPARYVLPEGGRWEEVLLYGRHPCVRAGFEDHEGAFKIDTGAAGDTVTLHYQVVHDRELLEGRTTTPGQAGGVGGFVATRVGPVESFRLGGHEFTAISAGFAVEDKGAFSDDYVWGNIGGKLLEPFRLVFDYPGGRVGFVPRKSD